MNNIKFNIILIIFISLTFTKFVNAETTINEMNFYDFKIEDIQGEEVSLDIYKGKTILLVNVASNCGFTNQYGDLQNLWEKYKEKNLIVLGVPSNQFGNQEPGSNSEIKNFCEVNFNVNFPMTSKYDVKGENAHDIYKWAKATFGNKAVPKWNFHKILIDKNGKVHDTFVSFTNPMSQKVLSEIEKIL
tara:strand:+ start:1175 stop:1738 length:564 start_codon:yes stop_codon:yes gene_type:complete